MSSNADIFLGGFRMQNSQAPHDYSPGLFMTHKESEVFIFIAGKLRRLLFKHNFKKDL